jgi:hypothetical protein
MNSSVDMLLEPNCQCSFFQQGIWFKWIVCWIK